MQQKKNGLVFGKFMQKKFNSVHSENSGTRNDLIKSFISIKQLHSENLLYPHSGISMDVEMF